jgi:D-tyrosyl-tRNA(Tyr) deacylase
VKALIQRVSSGSVAVDGIEHGRIGPGLVVLIGVARDDDANAARALAAKCARLRIFDDEQGKMNRALLDTGGAALVVSQFTLCADTDHGLRPSFTPAAPPEPARELYEQFVRELGQLGVTTTTGVFGARMLVRIDNDGPVTFMLDTAGK